MSDNWTDFVSVDPWFRPTAARLDAALAFLRGELAPGADIGVRNDDAVSVFFSPQGDFEARCPRCGVTTAGNSLSERFNDDYDKERGFRLEARAMPCCGVKIALTDLIYAQPIAFARFGFSILYPQWKFRTGLASERAVREMEHNSGWIRAREAEWRSKHAKWSADVCAGEQEIASRLEPILGCGIRVVYEHF